MNRTRASSVNTTKWYNNADTALNRVLPSFYHDYANQRYYNSADGETSLPFTATRTTNATMFNPAGQLVFAPANMILNSEDLSTASWANTASTELLSGTTPPPGVSTVYKLQEDGTNSAHSINTTSITIPANSPICFSAYMKADDRNYGIIQINDGTSANAAWTSFDLSTGTVIQPPLMLAGLFTNMSSNTENIGNGWWRVNFKVTLNTTANITCYFGISSNGLLRSYIGTVGIGIFISGAQLELSGVDSPKKYNLTSGTAFYGPRFDYAPANGEALGVLIEEAATNLIPASLNIPVSSMSELGVTRLASPLTYLGGWSAVRVTSNGANSTHAAYPHSLAPTGSTTVSMQAIICPISGGKFYQLTGSGSWMADLNGYANFDLTGDGSVTATGASASTPFIRNLGNGVYHIGVSVTTTAGPSSAAACIVGIITSGTDLRLPINTSTAAFDYIYAGFYQSQSGWSSVIPTFGVTATRAADTLANAVGTWFTQGSGTIYAGFTHPTIVSGIYPAIIQIDDGTGNNRVQAFSQSNATTTSTGARIDLAGSPQVNTGVVNTVPYFGSNRYVVSYALNNTRMALNGGAVVLDSVGTVPTGLTTYRPGGTQAPTTSERWVKEIRFYQTASASDAQLQTLTT